MANTKLSALTEFNAKPSAADLLYMVDVSDAGDGSRKIKTQRFAVTDGSVVAFTGGGTIALGGQTLTANASGTLVTTDDTQTLANKTLTVPTIEDFASANHNHSDAGEGGTLDLIMPTCIQIGNVYGPVGASYNSAYQYCTSFWLDSRKIKSNLDVHFRAYASVYASGTLYFQLYNATSGAAVSGSELSTTTAYDSYSLCQTTSSIRANLGSGAHRYYVRLKIVGAGTAGGIFSACLVID